MCVFRVFLNQSTGEIPYPSNKRLVYIWYPSAQKFKRSKFKGEPTDNEYKQWLERTETMIEMCKSSKYYKTKNHSWMLNLYGTILILSFVIGMVILITVDDLDMNRNVLIGWYAIFFFFGLIAFPYLRCEIKRERKKYLQRVHDFKTTIDQFIADKGLLGLLWRMGGFWTWISFEIQDDIHNLIIGDAADLPQSYCTIQPYGPQGTPARQLTRPQRTLSLPPSQIPVAQPVMTFEAYYNKRRTTTKVESGLPPILERHIGDGRKIEFCEDKKI